jgi:hypothetical protein
MGLSISFPLLASYYPGGGGVGVAVLPNAGDSLVDLRRGGRGEHLPGSRQTRSR